MKRLTQRSNFGTAYYPRCFEKPCIGDGCKIKDCLFDNTICERLAAYEDTGYTPDEIVKLRDDLIVRNAELLDARKEIKIFCSCGCNLDEPKMTPQEAIGRIRDHMAVHHIGKYPHVKLAEALEMAIKALMNMEKK